MHGAGIFAMDVVKGGSPWSWHLRRRRRQQGAERQVTLVAQQEKHVAGLSRGHVHAAATGGLRGMDETIRNSQNHASHQ